jgi:hypothetical protein
MADPIVPVNPFTPQMQNQFSDLLALNTARAQRQEPVHQAAMAMAQHLAPGYAQHAMSGPTALSGSGGGAPGGAGLALPASAGAGGGGLDAKKLALLAPMFAAIMHGASGGGGDIGGIVGLLKKLFGHGMNFPNSDGSGFGGNHTTTISGNDPSGSGGLLPSSQDPFGTLFGNGGGIPTAMDFMPNDPSGGTGVGPGMQDFRGGSSGDPGGWWKP